MHDNIKLFDNLSQNYYNEKYYDLHNDYECFKLELSNQNLILFLKNRNDNTIISLLFDEVSIIFLSFINTKDVNSLVIDNIYRGRFEKEGILYDISDDDKYYFYLEFVEGQKMEFFAKQILLNNIEFDHEILE